MMAQCGLDIRTSDKLCLVVYTLGSEYFALGHCLEPAQVLQPDNSV